MFHVIEQINKKYNEPPNVKRKSLDMIFPEQSRDKLQKIEEFPFKKKSEDILFNNIDIESSYHAKDAYGFVEEIQRRKYDYLKDVKPKLIVEEKKQDKPLLRTDFELNKSNEETKTRIRAENGRFGKINNITKKN